MKTVSCERFDFIVPSHLNPEWLQRCLSSIYHNTNPACINRVIVVGQGPMDPGRWRGAPNLVLAEQPERTSWLDAMRIACGMVETPLVVHVQDDCLIVPGSPAWAQTLSAPFAHDPFVATVCSVTNESGFPHQRITTGLEPGFYYTSAFAPICFVFRPKLLLEAIRGIEYDMVCDHEPWMNLMERGWKVVMATCVFQYHKGAQSNLRVYGGDDPMAFVEEWKTRTGEEIRKRHSEVWMARAQSCEMVRM